MHARAIYPCLLFVVFLIPTLTAGANPPAGKRPRRLYPPAIDGYASASRAIEKFDDDEDGKISGAELDRCPGLKAAIENVDADGDGAITAEEITARIHAWQKSKLGRTYMSCRVLHNGKPLEGVEVRFVPEKFLGDTLKTATGKTDNNGMAPICVPGYSPPGIAPGFYRVEITKDGEKIPVKYNTQTIFGQEIAIDAKGIQEGIEFDLKY